MTTPMTGNECHWLTILGTPAVPNVQVGSGAGWDLMVGQGRVTQEEQGSGADRVQGPTFWGVAQRLQSALQVRHRLYERLDDTAAGGGGSESPGG